MPQAIPAEVPEAEVVPLPHQLVPARLLVGPDWTDQDFA
jgi:hypothetical protein